METTQSTLVLCDKRWLGLKKSFLAPLLLVLGGMTAALLFAVTVIFPDAPWDKLPSLLIRKLSAVDWPHAFFRHIETVIIFCALIMQALYLNRAQKLERLTLSPVGISYISPLPPILKYIKPDWSLPWNQIQKIELSTPNRGIRNPEFTQLAFVAASSKQRIFPMHWIDTTHYTPSAFWSKFTFSSQSSTPEDIRMQLMDTAVMQYISRNASHITIDSRLRKAEIYTSLEKNPHGRIALGIVTLLILYAIIDFVAVPDSFIDDPLTLLHIFIPAGIGAAALSGIWLYRSSLTSGEKAGLAFLIGMLVAVALIPGALRINALTDTTGPVTYDYYVVQGMDGVLLHPVVDGMPVIDYFARNKFWGKFGRNDTYPVQIQKGILGFYQFNSSAIVDDIHRNEKGN